MPHAHEYRFWHAHEHVHTDSTKGASEWKVTYIDDQYRFKHDTGHYHLWAQAHYHGGKSDLAPHTHKDKQYHPEDDGVIKHHHADADHKPLDWGGEEN